jgi:hypothetical protein
MTTDPRFFEWVAELVKDNWPADVMELNGRSYIFGQVEAVLLFEVEPEVQEIGHIVRTRTDFARNVPATEELHLTLAQLNRSISTVTFGVKPEVAEPGSVAVKAFSALLGEAATTESLINASIRSCLSAAFLALEGGFIAKFGGEVGRDVTLREIGVA